MDVSTTTTFYNDVLGGINPAGINPVFYPIFPTLELDSWVTIGVLDSMHPGANYIGQASTIPSDPWTGSVGNTEGQSLIINDGAWFTLPTSPSALPTGPNNRVLLGQFTTDGTISINLNIQVFIGGDLVNGRVDYVHTLACEGDGFLTGFEQPMGTLSQTVYIGQVSCDDEEACNYLPNSADDSWCCYDCTCTDPEASNYGRSEGCDNISVCTYDVTVTLINNANGQPMADFSFTLDPLGETTSTNSEGVFTFEDVPYGLHNLGFEDPVFYYFLDLGNSSAFQFVVGGNDLSELTYYVDAPLGCMDVTACNYDSAAVIDDGSCIAGSCGCMDPEACNFLEEPDNIVDCIYPTCTDENTCNYYAISPCEVEGNEHCEYNGELTILVYQDFDGDGDFDGGFDGWGGFWANEPTMINTQVIINELGWIGFTNENGFVTFQDLPTEPTLSPFKIWMRGGQFQRVKKSPSASTTVTLILGSSALNGLGKKASGLMVLVVFGFKIFIAMMDLTLVFG
ncbi:MAG: hypothetical protein MK081_04390 [Flavobacteriales bacterium]|nr:hypothetical protein [Flavobacteriales bacterium]